MSVLVTAASGGAGRSIVEALLDRGIPVIAASRRPDDLSFPDVVETRAFDADVVTDYDRLFAGVDDVVLVAPPLDGLIHEKLAPFIDAVAGRIGGRLVYLSGNYLAGMTGATLDELPVRKLEKQVMASGLEHVIVRAGFFMDNYLTGFYAGMVGQGRITLATGDGKSALIAASDVGAFVAEALIQDLRGEFIVTGPEALDHYEVAALLSRKLGTEIVYTPVTEPQLADYYASRSLGPESTAYGLTLYRAYRNHATAPVTDGFERVVGRPPVGFVKFLGLN